jgi:hypothetical protein
VLPNGETLDILEHKIRSIQLFHDSYELANERIARIIERAFSNEREALARCTTKDDVDCLVTNAGLCPNLSPRQTNDGAREHRRLGKVKFVGRSMNGIVLHSGDDVETRLFEAQAETSSSSK